MIKGSNMLLTERTAAGAGVSKLFMYNFALWCIDRFAVGNSYY